MKKKLEDKGRLKTLPITFSIKDIHTDGGETVIEGWANKAVIDRGKDFIGKSAWDLTNFEKNPVILFNHDKDKPIGKALGIEATDEGLYIKARISKSKDPMVSYVRDMIKEGILNAFSVGFDARNEAKNTDGINEIKTAELYEVSVVSLPMNQDSIFTLTSKDLKVKTYQEARAIVMTAKGAEVAAGLLEAIDAKKGDAAAIAELVAETSGASLDDVKAVLSGDLTPVPEKILAAFAATLELKVEDLQSLDAADVDASDEPSGDNGMQVQSVMVPKAACGGDMEKAMEMCKAAGYGCENMKEEGDNFVAEQAPADGFESLKAVDLGDGCSAMMGKKTAAPLDPATENPPEVAPAPEADKPIEAKAVTTPIGQDPELGMDDNPHLMQSRQTNILLGTLIQEIQNLSKIIQGGIIADSQADALESRAEVAAPIETAPVPQKSIDIVSQRLKALDERLKLMGV